MPAERSQFALQVRIGAFILSGLLVFVAIIYLLGAQARYFERKYDLTVEFVEVGGLIEGATVRLAGVQIGRVTAVTLPEQPGAKVRVTLTIARRFSERIRRDSEARIATQGLLGDKIVEITLGSTDVPALKPGESLVSSEPFEMQQMFKAGVETMQTVKELAAGLKSTVARVDRHRQGGGDRQGPGPRAGLRRAGVAQPAQRDPGAHPADPGPGRAGRQRGRASCSRRRAASRPARCSRRWTRSAAGRRRRTAARPC